jgi:hypothetical protein
VKNREVTLGASDSTWLDIITKTAKQHGLGNTICHWIGATLGGRKIWGGGSVARSSQREGMETGYEEFLGGLNENVCDTLQYADGIAIHIGCQFPNTGPDF